MTNENDQPLVRIIDDDPGVRQSTAFLLEAAGFQTACFAGAEEFLGQGDASRPGCLLLDARMPGMTGLELQDALQERGIALPVIFITGHGDVDMAVHVLKQGAVDFLQKPVDAARLISVTRAAVERSVAARRQERRVSAEREAYGTLTDREKEVVRLVAQGLQNKEIAQRLAIAEKTVKVHRGSACRKLSVRNGVDIAALLARIGVS